MSDGAVARALVLEAPRHLAVREFRVPAVGDNDALVRVAACGLCGTDHEQYTGELASGPAAAIALMLQTLGGPVLLGWRPGRHHVAHAAAGRHARAGEVHERRSVACAGSRLHLRPSVVGRGGHPARRGGAAHRLHRAADCARAKSQESHRRRGSVARHESPRQQTRCPGSPRWRPPLCLSGGDVLRPASAR